MGITPLFVSPHTCCSFTLLRRSGKGGLWPKKVATTLYIRPSTNVGDTPTEVVSRQRKTPWALWGQDPKIFLPLPRNKKGPHMKPFLFDPGNPQILYPPSRKSPGPLWPERAPRRPMKTGARRAQRPRWPSRSRSPTLNRFWVQEPTEFSVPEPRAGSIQDRYCPPNSDLIHLSQSRTFVAQDIRQPLKDRQEGNKHRQSPVRLNPIDLGSEPDVLTFRTRRINETFIYCRTPIYPLSGRAWPV